MRGTAQERFWSKVDGIGDDTCWTWNRPLTHKGYGIFFLEGQMQPAHRIAWELSVGPIPEGFEIDHLCRVRHCMNPQHLDPVTPTVNRQRAENPQSVKTHCPEGHAYDWIDNRGHRRCRTCHRRNVRLAARRLRAHRKAEGEST